MAKGGAGRDHQTRRGGSWENGCQSLWGLPAPGGVVEWLMAPVLKTGDPQGSVGSNPTPSAARFRNCSRANTGLPKAVMGEFRG